MSGSYASRQEFSQAAVDFAELVDTMCSAMGSQEACPSWQFDEVVEPLFACQVEAEEAVRSQTAFEEVLEQLGLAVEGIGSGEDAALDPMAERAANDIAELGESWAPAASSLDVGPSEGPSEGMGVGR